MLSVYMFMNVTPVTLSQTVRPELMHYVVYLIAPQHLLALIVPTYGGMARLS